MKFRYPKGIVGGILKYGFNPTAVLHVLTIRFINYDAERMRVKREARLAREAAAKTQIESESETHVDKEKNDDGHHRQSG